MECTRKYGSVSYQNIADAVRKYIRNFEKERYVMSKQIICHGKTRLTALYTREKVAADMYKSAKNDKEREYYMHELEDIRAEIGNMTVCD